MKKRISLEMKRQLFHVLIGSILGLLVAWEIIDWIFLTLLLILLLILAGIHMKRPLKILNYIVHQLERPKVIPGTGAILMVFGILLATLLYPPLIAGAATLILAFGDSASTFFGKKYGEIKLKVNKKKSLEGSFAGFLFAFIASMFLVGIELAFLGSFVGMFFESINDRVGLDDNLIIPVVAGIAMVLAL